MTDKPHPGMYFEFFNEVGIINQLARAMLEKKLPAEMTVHQFTVINHLLRVRDGQTPLFLSRAFQVPKTTMSHTLSELEKRDLIRLGPNPEDGRSKCVWITDKGRAVLAGVFEKMGPEIPRLMEHLPLDAVAAVLPQLNEIRKIMDAMRNNEPDEGASGG